jgi:hypothetical protein
MLQNATFFAAIVEPCTALQRGNRWPFKPSITGKRSKEQASDIGHSPWAGVLKRPRTDFTSFECATTFGSISGSSTTPNSPRRRLRRLPRSLGKLKSLVRLLTTFQDSWHSGEVCATFEVQIQLSSDRSLFAAQAARDSLFQHLNHNGRRSPGRLSDQQMNVIRHDDVAHEGELVAVPDSAENLDKHIPGADRTQQRHAAITTEGNDVMMPAPLDASKFVGHRGERHQIPDPSKDAKGPPPGKAKPVTRR